MAELFKRAAVFSDHHFGMRNNSDLHNQDCLEFIQWFIDTAHEHDCDTCLFLGDYHHHRAQLNIKTMKASIAALELIGQNFQQTFFLLGNHDIHLKEARTIHSIDFGRHIPGITIVSDPIIIDNVTLCPWLVGDEWKMVGKKPTRYIFGHFELPLFYMNSMIQMPDHGLLQAKHFAKYDLAFSGHFHKRQTQKNIHYIGNTFPHNYGDADDNERGMMILEWGSKPEYYTWPNQPTFKVLKLSQLIDDPATVLKPKSHLRVTVDIDISFEEANFIREQFMSSYQLREFSLIPEKVDIESDLIVTDISTLQTVDQIVADGIVNIDSDTFNKNTLLDIYTNL